MDSTLRTARLLLVDGDADAARNTALAFAGCFLSAPEFREAPCGRNAGEMLRAEAFDLVVADLDSIADLAPRPEDAVTRLVKLGGNALTIALTEGSSVSSALTALRAGAHDVFSRPLVVGALAARMGQLAMRHGRSFGLVVDGLETRPRASEPSAVIGMPAHRTREVLPMWRQEQRIIEEAIAAFAGNVAMAAAALELSPSTIYRKRQAWAEMETVRKGAA